MRILASLLVSARAASKWATMRAGQLLECAAIEGIPGIIVELLYWYRIDPLSAGVGTRGVLNVMKALDMIDGEMEQQPIRVFEGELSGAEQTCDEGGLVFMTKDVGDEVVEGETIAIVRDAYGNVLEEIKSPVTGWVTAYPLRKNQNAMSGDTVAFFVYRKDQASDAVGRQARTSIAADRNSSLAELMKACAPPPAPSCCVHHPPAARCRVLFRASLVPARLCPPLCDPVQWRSGVELVGKAALRYIFSADHHQGRQHQQGPHKQHEQHQNE